MRRLLTLFILFILMVVMGGQTYAMDSNPPNIIGNAWWNTTITPAPGVCVPSNAVLIEGKNNITIYQKLDSNTYAVGGYLTTQLSPDGISWYTMQGMGWFNSTPTTMFDVLPEVDSNNGVYNFIFSVPEGSVVSKYIRFKTCFAVTNMTISVFAR